MSIAWMAGPCSRELHSRHRYRSYGVKEYDLDQLERARRAGWLVFCVSKTR